MPAARSAETVQVVVRSRPLSTKEKNEGRKPCVDIDLNGNMVSIRNLMVTTDNTEEAKPFTFDAVYDETCEQKIFYEESCYNLVESVLEGFNGTIFASGQTGCGKTHTMQGLNEPPELRGVIPRSFDHIFEAIRISPGCEFLVRCSYLEIYNEEVRDLLSKKPDSKLDLKEDPAKVSDTSLQANSKTSL
jgi:kinesin family protein 3/17